jgi:hypothetical protein
MVIFHSYVSLPEGKSWPHELSSQPHMHVIAIVKDIAEAVAATESHHTARK